MNQNKKMNGKSSIGSAEVTETQTTKRYNVEIFEYATGKTEAVIGKNLTERKAERRLETGLSRCNPDYGVRIEVVL